MTANEPLHAIDESNAFMLSVKKTKTKDILIDPSALGIIIRKNLDISEGSEVGDSDVI